MDQNLIVFNGIDGESGRYTLPPMTGAELYRFIQGEAPAENLNELRSRYLHSTQATYGIAEGMDPLKLEEAGWGVIFASDGDPAVQDALRELLDLRREQAGELFKIYAGSDGHRRDESKGAFLARHGAGPGPAVPRKVPYYLLIVGSPERIPFQFQTQLDVQYAVGRIFFDTLEEYASYAHSVVLCEKGQVKLPRQAAFFGTAHPGDQATTLSAACLVGPLKDELQAAHPDWQLDSWLAEQATKARLASLLGGDPAPAVLFSASHGMNFPLSSSRQLQHQGALLCQDWPGPAEWGGKGPIPADHYFSGDDLSAGANLLGRVAFFFACYGAGTPLNDAFSQQAFKKREAIAPRPFLARLPTRMLGHPRGGALAVVGHVERAWGYSFQWQKAGAQTAVFQSSLARLFKGQPVGLAFEYFNERYAELSTVLSDELEEVQFGKTVDPFEMSGMWTANNDARGYTILGDPAVRVPVLAAGEISPAQAGIIAILQSPASPLPPGQPSSPAAGVAALPPAAALAPQARPVQPARQIPMTVPGEPAPPPAAPLPPAAQPPASLAQAPASLAQAPASLAQAPASLAEARAQLERALSAVTGSLSQALAGLSSGKDLEIATYTSPQLRLASQDPSLAELRVFTRIKPDGHAELLLPPPEAPLDRAVWEMHLEMVRQAQAGRAELLQAVTAAAAAATAAAALLKELREIQEE